VPDLPGYIGALVDTNPDPFPGPSLVAADVLTAVKTVDGAGSGLDADLLDGTEAAGFAPVVHTHPSSTAVTAVDRTLATTDEVVIVTAASKTMTLYTAAGNTGRRVIIKNASVGTCVVDGHLAETIDGTATITVASSDAVEIVSDGTNWRVV